MSNVPQNLSYLPTHEWASFDGDVASVGITDFAQSELGDLVFINLPAVGDTVSADENFCDVESVKAVSDIVSPVTGEIVEVNESLADHAEKLNETPYESWIVKVRFTEKSGELMDAAAYAASID